MTEETVDSETLPTIRYRIDADDCITWVNENWLAHDAAGAEELRPRHVLGRKLWDFIADPGTARVYRILLDRIRTVGKTVTFSHRCDSPQAIRRNLMTIRQAGDGLIEFADVTLKEEPRKSGTSVTRASTSLPWALQMCSICARVRDHDSPWNDLDDVLDDLEPFSDGTLRVSYRMCGDCERRLGITELGEEQQVESPAEPRLQQWVVGIGASAGGLESLQSFFGAADPGLAAAYVVVQHLSPDYKSLMVEILEGRTALTVEPAEHGAELKDGHVYVVQPGYTARIQLGRIALSPQGEPRHTTFPIDEFFRSLAYDVGDHGIAVILSGTGSDGSRGARFVKQAGGLVVAESPETASFDGMPNAVIESGSADFVLGNHEMPGRIKHFIRLKSVSVVSDEPVRDIAPLEAILSEVADRKGADMRHYRVRTLARRVARRMVIRGHTDLASYHRELSASTEEMDALFDDLLIKVTAFRRDPEAFEALVVEVRRVALDLPTGQDMRLWVAGCCTGEEAYTLAFLCEEVFAEIGKEAAYSIIASDLDPGAIRVASAGLFSGPTVDVFTPEERERYFVHRDAGWTIDAAIRSRILFVEHDVVDDTPFTRMDVITCRNLLIYLKPAAQQRALGHLTFGLNASGVLMLGPSESLGMLESRFDIIDRRWKVFRRIGGAVQLRSTQASNVRSAPTERSQRSELVPETTVLAEKVFDAHCRSLGIFLMALGAECEIRYSVGDSRPYLQMSRGRPTLELDELLHPHLRVVFLQAYQGMSERSVVVSPVPLPDGGQVELSIEKIAADVTVVVFRALDGQDETDLTDVRELLDSTVLSRMQNELAEARKLLELSDQRTSSFGEELQTANEELLSANEELQSTNEELHSVNDELHAVNCEHQLKIAALAELQMDMENYLRSADVSALFVDGDLRIRKYTHGSVRVLPLRAEDVGRPITELTPNVDGFDLVETAKQVLATKESRETRVTHEGRQLLLRVVPYRHNTGNVDGVIFTHIDVTALVEAENEKRRAESRFRRLAEGVEDGFFVATADGARVEYVNARFEGIWGLTSQELLSDGNAWLRRVLPEDRDVVLAELARLEKGEGYEVEYRIRLKDGTERWIWDRRSLIEDGEEPRIAALTLDISRRKAAEEAQKRLAERLEEQALSDQLTGLSNRRALERELERLRALRERQGGHLVAALVDLDGFKRVNDELGHAVGDRVLRAVANKLREELRPHDFIARVGGDEFLILLWEVRPAEAAVIVDRLRKSITEERIEGPGGGVDVTASIGIATVSEDVSTVEEVVALPSAALQRSKAAGKNCISGDGDLSVPTSDAGSVADMLIERSMTCVAQPIMRIDDGSCYGYELLSRGPEGPVRMPKHFLRQAIENNFLDAVDLNCLRTCARAAASAADHLQGRLHFNIFPSTILSVPTSSLLHTLDEHLDLNRICLELSEQQFVGGPPELQERLGELRAAGIRIALDDVGFGRSSLEALLFLEPEVIKLDRTVVDGVAHDSHKRRLLQRLKAMSSAITETIVAEGVEAEDDRVALREIGIPLAQGYLWERPFEVEAEAAAS